MRTTASVATSPMWSRMGSPPVYTCALTGGEPRCSPLVDPGEIGVLAMEETADGIHQHGVGSSGMETARLLERQDALHPPVAFVTGRPKGPLPPQHPKP